MDLQQQFRHMTPEAFATFGVQQVAYVKATRQKDGEVLQTIHLADGTQIAVAASRELAFATVRQNDLEPLSVH